MTDLPTTGGVYKVTVGDVFYVGQTSNFKRRERFHRGSLLRGVSTSRELQAHYDLVGEYEFTILCHEDDADAREKKEKKAIAAHAEDPCCMNFVGVKKTSATARERISRGRRGEANYIAKHEATGKVESFSSQKQLAEYFKVSRQTIKNYMEGKAPLPGTGKVLNKRTAHLVGWTFHYADH